MIPFTKPHLYWSEEKYISDAIHNWKHCWRGKYTEKCEKYIEKISWAKKVLLTTSWTAALELCCLLINLKEWDEVLVPSYTFTSTLNCIVLRWAKPVFCDCLLENWNIDPMEIEKRISPSTKAIMVMHYWWIACDMEKINKIATDNNLFVIEDAAQCIWAKHNNQSVWTFWHLWIVSFHETKNIWCWEWGCILINDESFIDRAEILIEKWTNRSKFMMWIVDKYTWVDLGSSYIISDILAAMLRWQLENIEKCNEKRVSLWILYTKLLKQLIDSWKIKIQKDNHLWNWHIFYLLTENKETRNKLIEHLKNDNIRWVFHYSALHSSPMGKKYCNYTLENSTRFSDTIVRLPLFFDLQEDEVYKIAQSVISFFEQNNE